MPPDQVNKVSELGNVDLLSVGRHHVFIACPPALISEAIFQYRSLPQTIERIGEMLRRYPVALQRLRLFAFRNPGAGLEARVSDDQLITAFVRSVHADRLRAILLVSDTSRH